MLSFLSVLGVTILFSFIPERFIKPKAPRLTATNIFLQALLVSMLFLVLSLIVQRAVFSGIAIIVFLIILMGVNNAKYKVLREPMVFSDFAMFSQAFKHPRLYFPFLGLLPVIIAPLIIIGLIYAVLTLEPALAFSWERILSTILAIIIAFFISHKIALGLKLSTEPEEDNAAYGLQNSLYAYALQARTKAHKAKIRATLLSSPFANQHSHKDNEKTPPLFLTIPDKEKPNITVIQSESFFDARRLHPVIKTDVLENFDACNAASVQHGKLSVPAWGANTMRTEFSFLTGLAYEDMGYYRYYPYQFLSKMPISSIASALKSQGYYCVCIHPHPASFFGRDKLFPKMGFDEFIDLQQFDPKLTFGPYISDQAVTDKILEVTRQKTDKPLFMFVITMENHGPLHLEKVTTEEEQSYYSSTPLVDTNDLSIYLRHLKNADQMIKSLTSEYQKSATPTTICFYGDHIPSMPKIYQSTSYIDKHADYFIWQNKQIGKAHKKIIGVETLAEQLLAIAGFKTKS